MNEPKQRLVVMNGQRLLQTLQGEEWVQAGPPADGTGLRPSIINLYRAVDADSSKAYTGQIVHADDRYVYQQVPAGIVRFDLAAFKEPPSIGANATVSLEQGEATVAEAGQANSVGIAIRGGMS